MAKLTAKELEERARADARAVLDEAIADGRLPATPPPEVTVLAARLIRAASERRRQSERRVRAARRQGCTRLFHRSSRAGDILATGFTDRIQRGGQRGVLLSDRPLDDGDGNAVLEVWIDEALIAEFERVDGKAPREWCVPAALLNRHAAARLRPARRQGAMGPGPGL